MRILLYNPIQESRLINVAATTLVFARRQCPCHNSDERPLVSDAPAVATKGLVIAGPRRGMTFSAHKHLRGPVHSASEAHATYFALSRRFTISHRRYAVSSILS
jgi:hypothetical protein